MAPAWGLTATVLSGGNPVTTGTVTFYNGATSLGTGSLSASGMSTFATTTLPVGTDSITASYGATTNYAASTSAASSISIGTEATTTSLSAPASATYGTSVSLTATVLSGGNPVTTGTVTFYNGATSLGTGSLSASGMSTFATTTLPVGTDSITASYAATTNYSASTSAATSISVGTEATTTTLSAPASATYGASVSLTATVLSGGNPVTTGIVTFYNGATSLGTASLNSSGVATLATTTLPVGTDSITASYGATTNYAASTSAATSISVGTEATTTTLSAPASATYGASVSLTATVLSGGNPVTTGIVTFYNGATSLGTGSLNSSGVATLTTATLPVGTDSITASYAATTNYAASTSVASSISVGTEATTTTLSAPASATYGASVSLAATVLAGGNPVTAGTVIFYNGATSLGTGSLNSSGSATLATTTLPVGTDSITASYGATTNYAASTSAAGSISVGNDATTTSLSVPPSATYGTSVSLTATVVSGGNPVTTGTVTFYNGATSLGAGSLNSSGAATLATTTLPVGTDSITASYGATTNYAASTSAASSVTITAIVASNLIQDPGFEASSSLAPYWKVDGGPTAAGVDVASADGHSGTNDGYIYDDSGKAKFVDLSQTVTVTPNTIYTLTGWVDASNTKAGLFGVRTVGGTNLGTSALANTDPGPSTHAADYRQYTVTFNSGSATSVVVFTGYTTPGSGSFINVDDMSLAASGNVAPSAPTNLAATASNGSVSLGWTGSAGATSYNIYRGTSSGQLSEITSGVSGTSYLDSTVTDGTPYFYEVTAVDNFGESVPSNEVTATPVSNLIQDPGFEASSSLAPHWKVDGGPTAAGVDGASADAHSGTNDGYIYDDSGKAKFVDLSQTVTITPNTIYTLTGWVDASNTKGGLFGVRTVGGTNLATSALANTDPGPSTHAADYRQYTVTFNSGSATSVVVFAGYTTPGSGSFINVDDMSLLSP